VQNFLPLSLLMMLLFAQPGFSQNQTDPVERTQFMGQTAFTQNGKLLTSTQLMRVTGNIPGTREKMLRARRNSRVSTIISSTGGCLFGYFGLGPLLSGDRPNWVLAGAGVGLLGVTIPFNRAATRHAGEAVDLYNEQVRPMGHHKPSLQLGMTGQGVGLRLRF
jgi:hypothetical protein